MRTTGKILRSVYRQQSSSTLLLTGNHRRRVSMAGTQYLEDFGKLGEQIFYDKPVSTQRKDTDPNLIVLFTWLYALPKHISKYTAQYRKLYPAVPILLLKQDGPDMIWRPRLFQLENLQPAVDVVQSLQAESRGNLSVLVHAWSNGGCYTACQFAESYAMFGPKAVNQEPKPPAVPISALIIDSAPSGVSMRSGFVALSQGLPASWPGPLKLLFGGMIWTTMQASAWVGQLFGVEGTISGMRRKLNEPLGPFIQGGIPRMYIYSETDELIPWQDVEEHAEQAQQALQGSNSDRELVRKEKFQGSKHVSHVVVDPDRYWNIVQSFWKASIEK